MLIILLLQPAYLKWLGYDSLPVNIKNATTDSVDTSNSIINTKPKEPTQNKQSSRLNSNIIESLITVVTPLYTVTLSNLSGGSIVDYTLNHVNSEKYLGGYNKDGAYQSKIPVSLVITSHESCLPCLAYYDDMEDKYNFVILLGCFSCVLSVY